MITKPITFTGRKLFLNFVTSAAGGVCVEIQDAEGRPAGIVMANRSGRQAVKAKVIIDATARAGLARIAGASGEPYPAGLQRFTRIVVSEEKVPDDDIQARKMPSAIQVETGGLD